jgi:hypothetical protein
MSLRGIVMDERPAIGGAGVAADLPVGRFAVLPATSVEVSVPIAPGERIFHHGLLVHRNSGSLQNSRAPLRAGCVPSPRKMHELPFVEAPCQPQIGLETSAANHCNRPLGGRCEMAFAEFGMTVWSR